jgi:hypothetical protein
MLFAYCLFGEEMYRLLRVKATHGISSEKLAQGHFA